MKSIRESTLFNSNRRLAERKSIIGSTNTFTPDVFRDKIWFPHEEMIECVRMYNNNSYAQSAINTMKDFIKGGDLIVRSKDAVTQKLAQAHLEDIGADMWIDEIIENTIKTGNAYLEMDFSDPDFKHPIQFYPIASPERIYINSDQFGQPKKIKRTFINPITHEPQMLVERDTSEYYIQRLDEGYRYEGAKFYDMSYHFGSKFRKFRIYGIPIDMRKFIHFRLNLGDTGLYGRSYMASALDDDEILKQIERSLAVIAKYKAVPRDILMYGDKDNPATDDEMDDFIIYLESLEKDESAIVNKPIKRETMSYAGQDINLDYMITHVNKKIIAGIAPDFLMGLGRDVDKANAQIGLISYILSIYSKRKLFLKPILTKIMRPWLRKNNLSMDTWLEFGELDFETQAEKTNRIGSLWTQNILTLNETREKLGLAPIGEEGDVYYMKWQQDMMGGGMGDMWGSMGSDIPETSGTEEGGNRPTLPNGEDVDQVFSHNDAPNRKNLQDGGKAPFDPYQDKTDEPKFLQKKDLHPPGAEMYIPKVGMPNDYSLFDEKDHTQYINTNKKTGHIIKENTHD